VKFASDLARNTDFTSASASASASGIVAPSAAAARTDLTLPSDATVKTLMWRSVGLFRDAAGLSSAVDQLEEAWRRLCARPAPRSIEEARVASLITVGRLMARAALRREESRGGHYRSDFAERDDVRWRRHVSEQI
jgi:L-aspartate oxidase